MSIHTIEEETLYKYPKDSFVKCENAILEVLLWKTLIPTSSEILKLLLYLSNPVHDFTEIIAKTNKYIFGVLIQYEFTCFKHSSIALSCLMISLE